MSFAYLDNNATTRVDPLVVEAMLPFFTEHYGNASSAHALGQSSAAANRGARASVRCLLGASYDDEIVFTSGGTESDNWAILSALEAQFERNEIVTSMVEHPAVLALCRYLEDSRRAKVHYVPVDSYGRLNVEVYRSVLSARTAIVSLMWANNETGTLFPVKDLAALAHDAGALFHTDAVQAVGKIPVDVGSSSVDMLSLSAHKLHGPKGVGVLYVRRGLRTKPLLRGGRQERGRRAGTENTAGIVGLGKAAELAERFLRDEQCRVRGLRDRLEQGILASIDRVLLLGDLTERLPNTSAIAFESVDAEAVLTRLDRAGVAASSGSACASGTMEPSHVVRAMKVPYTYAQGAIRFSLSRESTDSDVERVLSELPGIIGDLRKPPPVSQARRAISEPTGRFFSESP